MTIALIITATLLGLVAAGSATGKLQRKEALMTQLTGLGVPAAQVPLLGLLEIAGALGLLIGIWVPGLGVAAAFGLVLYFTGGDVTSTLVVGGALILGGAAPWLLARRRRAA
jgi:LPXTG-motif cell wall-anchored protein